MFRQYRLQDFRLRLVVLVYAITILGILVIGSAAEEYQSQQLLGMILGTVAMLVLTLMDYRILLNLSWVLYAVNIVLSLLLSYHIHRHKSISPHGGIYEWKTIFFNAHEISPNGALNLSEKYGGKSPQELFLVSGPGIGL